MFLLSQYCTITFDNLLAQRERDKSVKVNTVPVGQGDSTVIECPNGDISIIDMGCFVFGEGGQSDGSDGCPMGRKGYAKFIEKTFLEEGYSNLKHVFLTHGHADHMNYAYSGNGEGLLEKWSENWKAEGGDKLDIYIGDKDGWNLPSKKNFIAFLVQSNGFILKEQTNFPKSIEICSSKDSLKTTIKIITSDVSTKSLNARSMVMSLEIEGAKKMLFMGDFEHGYDKLMKDHKNAISNHSIVMVPHHGSARNGNPSEDFYKAVSPKHAIVSSSLWSRNSHPRMKHLEAICGNSGNSGTAPMESNDAALAIGWNDSDDSNVCDDSEDPDCNTAPSDCSDSDDPDNCDDSDNSEKISTKGDKKLAKLTRCVNSVKIHQTTTYEQLTQKKMYEIKTTLDEQNNIKVVSQQYIV